MKQALALALAFLLGGCATVASTDDPHVHLELANDGAVPLRCKLIFCHWTERDFGVLAPGATATLDIQQQPKDGALYILRSDGQRRMMIENLFCGEVGAWQRTMGQVDFAPARSVRARALQASCGAPGPEGKVACAPLALQP